MGGMSCRLVTYHFVLEVGGLEIAIRCWKLLQNPVLFRGPIQECLQNPVLFRGLLQHCQSCIYCSSE